MAFFLQRSAGRMAHSATDKPIVPNHLFWDSDVAKWIEGACYFLINEERDNAIEQAVHELVSMIASAQQPDGYINIHFTVVDPNGRFTNLRDFHELYNAGHLIEAALAHESCFNNDLLLAPLVKYVDLLCATFGNGQGQIPGYPGHPEIELALLRLYERTRDPKHLGLAKFFLTERGNPTGWEGRHFYDVEAEKRGDDPNKRPAFYPEKRCLWYNQAHKPIAEQEEVEGHAVRAMYLLTAAADLVRTEPDTIDQAFSAAVFRLWDNMVSKKMYVTGGIGAMKQWEGFGKNYFLPQGTDEGGCYSETCAAIGVMMLANRLLQLKLDGSFADVMELSFCNTVLGAMSHDGKKFTYVNQLASSNEDNSKRADWFTCACCPPNVLRLLAQIGGYLWSHTYDKRSNVIEIAVHLYVSSTLKFEIAGQFVELRQESNWPWEGNIRFQLKTSLRNVRIKLRIPGWAESFEISGKRPPKPVDGYVELSSEWLSANPSFTLSIPLRPIWIRPHPYTNQDTLSLSRGPVVYCVEDVDNPWVQDHFKAAQVSTSGSIKEHWTKDEKTGDEYMSLTVSDGASAIEAPMSLPIPWIDAGPQRSQKINELRFIPYYFRGNRGGTGQMCVGLRKASPTGMESYAGKNVPHL